jgi:hypothetical protein
MIDKPDYVKAREGKPLIRSLASSKADLRRRRDLIRQTVQAWYNLNPRYAKWMATFLKEITKVEHTGGKWRNGKGHCSLRLPRELFISLRKVFQIHAPDMEPFATDDLDIKILCEEFPNLMPTGNRGRIRKD